MQALTSILLELQHGLNTEIQTLTSTILELKNKLETENLKHALFEIQNDNENIKTELKKLQATCACTSATTAPQPTTTTLPSTRTITTTTKPATTTPFLHSCDEGWRNFNGHCFLFVKENKKWDDALAYCESMNSYLIEISTDAELEFAAEIIHELSGYIGFSWIGATDRVTEGTFVYQNSHQQVPKKYWRAGEPNNAYGSHCAAMVWYHGDLEFVDDRCSVKADFVCKKT